MSRKRNKVTYVEKDSEVDEDFSFEKKKKSKVDSEIDQDESTREGNSDDNSDSYEEGEKRRKKKKMKLCIPGERKSSRSKAGSNDLRELTDKEFEKMLEEEELQKINKKNKKKEQMNNTNNSSSSSISSNKNKIVTKLSKRINPKKGDDDNSHSGNESDHLWYCELCKDGGDLLLCDTCPKSFHKECLKIDGVPDGDWSCPVCKGEALPEKNESSDEDAHDTACRFCKDGGDVILCDFCPLVFHMHCLDPPLTSLPEGDWKCPICVIKMTPLKAKVKQVLTWRWKNKPEMLDELDHTHSPQKQQNKRNVRELFVKFEYHSYWDCEWMPELQLEVFQPITHMNFKRKFDQTEPPALDDGSSFGRPRHKNTSSEDDPHNLEERFYRYGIKPEWLQIHRIIGHDGKGKERRYLVKWRDLPYAECTWESIGELPGALEDFDKYLDIYWTRRKLKTSKDESKKADTPKKSSLRRKLEKQPAYIDDTGGCLHPYQLEGLNWLRFSWSQGTNTILADEMGLGKTVQAISFLYSLYKEGFATTKPFLVSAPLSTVPNWEREFEYWAPELYVVTYTGQKDNRTVIREHEFCYKEGAFSSKTRPCRMKEGLKPKFDVLLTSYEYVHMDYATLSSINWGVLIIDEAHRLKNNQSLFFRTMADYSLQYKLLLTGTPLQNNLEELFNLLHFLEPDKFQNMEEFLNEFSEISKDEQVMKLHELLAPHMLRRMKMDVLKDIPSKSEFIVRIELSSMQKKYYKHILTRNYEALNAKGYSNQTSLINIMMDLRKCCNHPYLFPAAEKDAPLTSQGLYEGSTLAKASGKLEMLEKMLNRLKRDGHRVLLFSQMTRMLDILEDFMTAKNYGYERIDGSIASNKRQECIDRFNSKDSPNFVFLLSTRAGGLGINLATADTVIIYDMDWNPHNDIQAFSRAHRIGQKNKVMIYRFVTRNTVEEKIAQVCKQKMMLSELIVHRGMSGTNSGQSVEKVDSLTRQEISDILKYGAENLFRDDEEGQVVYTDQDIERLLDRSIETEIEKEKEKDFGMNEYLRSFKVASYQVKEGVDDQEEEEEKEDEKEDSQLGNDEKIDGESDVQYWQRILGPAYNEHLIQTLKEQEELANKLGKGKRIRKQINYAEREMMETVDALSKRDSYNQALLQARKRCYLEEDVTFQSDYEPSSTSDEDATSAKEDDGSENSKKKKNQQKGPPPPLPPLVDRVDGQVLVLGFTARQRRAFLDAVMRYGMPPEDPYRSQWLVRDLRGKTERNFKAYVSLFMRHLCEPISDNSDKFADGVPREGLSRQHVLTRIGVVALIRKKVHEFEYMNGVESMAEFKPKNPLPPTIAPSLSNSSGVINISDTNDTTLSKGTTISTETTTTPILSTKINPTDSTATSSTTFITTSNTATTAASPTSSSNTAAADDKAIIVPDTPANTADVKTESEVPAAEVKDDSKAALSSEVATNQDITTATAVSKESTTTANTLSTANSVANSTVTEVKDEVTTTTTVTSVVSTTITSGITPTSASSCDVTNNNNKEAVSTSNTTAVTTNTTTQTSVTVAVTTTTTTAVSTAAEVQTNGSITKGSTKDLRSRFWIADGGFTELHSLWQLEEQQLVESRAYETWHRLHDFWLLAGVITHGYRHWQDILSDPRFEVLNQAFKSEGERARKAAFLNRRFQLLEQAMVIEEQLRKAISDNLIPFDTSVDINSTLPTQALARLKVLDDIGNTLKNSNNNDKSKSSKMQKVLNQINVLVNDINDMSYINMPASLCKPYPSMLRPQAPTLSNKPPTITSTWNNQHNKNTQYISPMAKSSSYSHNNYSRGEQVSNSGRMVNSNTSNTSNVKQSSATSSSTTSTTNNKDNNTSKDVICID